MKRSIGVVPHDPEWQRIFGALRQVYLHTLNEVAVVVEHVPQAAAYRLERREGGCLEERLPARYLGATI